MRPDEALASYPRALAAQNPAATNVSAMNTHAPRFWFTPGATG